MAIRLIREHSETPNVTNRDDAKMVRYAYGGYDGVVKNYGKELSFVVENNKLKLESGIIVYQGWEVEVDEAGWELDLSIYNTGIVAIRTYLILNLFNDTVRLGYITNTYYQEPNAIEFPEIDKGDDLTKNPFGVANFILYDIVLRNGRLFNYYKRFSTIDYAKGQIERLEKTVLPTALAGVSQAIKNDFQTGKAYSKYAQYASEDVSKGTIENRLEAGLTGVYTGTSSVSVDKTGIYVVYVGDPYWKTSVLCVPTLDWMQAAPGDYSDFVRYDRTTRTIKTGLGASSGAPKEMIAYRIASVSLPHTVEFEFGDRLSGGESTEYVNIEMYVLNGVPLSVGNRLVKGKEFAEITEYEDGMYTINCLTGSWFDNNRNKSFVASYLDGTLAII